MATDVEIAQAHTLEPITTIADRAGIPEQSLIPYGTTKAKIDITTTPTETTGKLVLVTGISPTPAGEGKSTVLIGLADAIRSAGRSTIVAIREPSLGPVMGIKGGAAGGGYSQIVPMEDINLHFTGDFHAITAANNTLAAMIDNHIHQGNRLGIDPRRVSWQRCVDVNDRSLRHVVTGLGDAGQGGDHYEVRRGVCQGGTGRTREDAGARKQPSRDILTSASSKFTHARTSGNQAL